MKPRKEPEIKPRFAASTTDWGQVAKWYDELVGEGGSEFHRHVVVPGALRLLAPQPGESALDVACGQGVVCRVLHKMGVRATGVDAAKELIYFARKRSDPAIQFIAGDARELPAIDGAPFDLAACILAIQNIHPILPVFESVARCLKPGGRFVVVMMHPCFRSPKATSWGWDEQHRTQYRRVDRYLMPRKEPIFTHPGSDPTHYTWTFHRPISAYIKALGGAGLLVDSMEEWPSHKSSKSGGKGTRGPAENTARKEIPMFMAIRAVKAMGQE